MRMSGAGSSVVDCPQLPFPHSPRGSHAVVGRVNAAALAGGAGHGDVHAPLATTLGRGRYRGAQHQSGGNPVLTAAAARPGPIGYGSRGAAADQERPWRLSTWSTQAERWAESGAAATSTRSWRSAGVNVSSISRSLPTRSWKPSCERQAAIASLSSHGPMLMNRLG